MEKFTKLSKKKKIKIVDDIVYDGNYLKILKEDDWEFVVENDCVVCLIYFKDEGYVLMRTEPVPPWQHKHKNDNQKLTGNYLTPMSGTIEKDESISNCLRRELYEEMGIVLNNFYQFEIEPPIFVSKGNSQQFHLCLLELNYNDYKLVSAPGDGSKFEKISKNVKISLGDLDNIKINDMVSLYLINKLKKNYNL